MIIVTLCQHAATGHALDAYVRAVTQKPGADEKLFGANIYDDTDALVDAFNDLSNRLDMVVSAQLTSLDQRVVVAVDDVRPTRMCAYSDGRLWENLISMLMLAFPDIVWCFARVQSGSNAAPNFVDANLKAALTGRLPDPLFDGSGLREAIRRRGPVSASDGTIVAVRDVRAVAVDDEPAFAYFHAYCAYRAGYCTEVVTRLRDMRRLFSGSQAMQFVFSLALEDLSLGFPDKLANEHFSDLEKRDSAFPHLTKVKARQLITSGQDGTMRPEIRDSNERFRRDCNMPEVILKPTGDMLALVAQAKMAKARQGAFKYLLQFDDRTSTVGEIGHSAPGRLLHIALVLIHRAEAMLRMTQNVHTALRGAVLATDALELTSGKSPATALDALSLKHQFEVIAECQFVASGYHANASPRISEIRADCEKITSWYDGSKRHAANLNSQMTIANAVLRLYREAGQYEEELAYSRWTSELEDQLKAETTQDIAAIWSRLNEPIVHALKFYLMSARLWPGRYLRLVTGSLLDLAKAMAIWIIFFTVVFALTSAKEGASWWWGNVVCGLSDAISSFFSIGPPFRPTGPDGFCAKTDELGVWYAVWVNLCIVLGALHLGLLVAMLVSKLNRK